jgi:hypothetical protein
MLKMMEREDEGFEAFAVEEYRQVFNRGESSVG